MHACAPILQKACHLCCCFLLSPSPVVTIKNENFPPPTVLEAIATAQLGQLSRMELHATHTLQARSAVTVVGRSKDLNSYFKISHSTLILST